MAGGWSRIAKRIRVPLGFAFAIFFLWLARPSLLFIGLSLLLVIPGLLLRAYASGYVKKNAELTMTGPYAYTRNPLYLGSMMIAFGFALASRSIWIALALAVLFAAIYIPVIQGEERFLRGAFAGFDDYAARVPRLLPRLSRAATPDNDGGGFSAALYRKHREYNALIGAVAIYTALALRLLFLR
ncbi:protein-S-isoprenylcysteine O-methyltransferase Ste14 [Silvibacterium bohemicum]|uniref:Protein-S-isoprenylcysteine O-methyltransferase Ste14 n=1 Tax=Silvibacterium bohemicum TaxID=1577686 RepID=A0A841K248_9BACT|nr:isoprenylcysteine carboxylmethyltransferase family protein [Silvibacterium bohemicum]MBB6147075.1 protein-S-isoprenylcysteine O-methyltransferase Ste14 [Silvibacterium bohemicum]